MKRSFILVSSALFAALIAAACGQRGPLVLPPPEARQTPQPKPASSPMPAPATAPSEKPKQ